MTGTATGAFDLDKAFEQETAHYRHLLSTNLHVIVDALRGPGAPGGRCGIAAAQTARSGYTPLLSPPDYVGSSFMAEIEEILQLQADPEREVRRDEILAEIDDIYTPFLDEMTDVSGAPGSVLRLMNLMDMAGYVIGYYFKQQFNRPRPHIADARVDPMIPVPSHSAYPSAHSVQTHLLAHALSELYTEAAANVAEFFDIAERISINREYAGVHYRSDTEAGKLIAQVSFPFLRVLFDPVFTDAIAEIGADEFANCRFVGALPTDRRAAEPMPDWCDGLTGNLRRLGVSAGTATGEDTLIVLVDKAVQVRHPAIAHACTLPGQADPLIRNLDYPVPLDDLWTMESKGMAHGTAMAALCVGRMEVPSLGPCGEAGALRIGVAPDARLLSMRALNHVRADHDDRNALASALIGVTLADVRTADILVAMEKGCPPRTSYAEIMPDVLVMALDFIRPEQGLYADMDVIEARHAQAREDGMTDADFTALLRGELDSGNGPAALCDPLLLALLLCQRWIPVVIASGNQGGDTLAYPAAFSDYEPVLRAMLNPATRPLVVEDAMAWFAALSFDAAYDRDAAYADLRAHLEAEMAGEATAALLERGRAAQADGATGAALDPFRETGLIVAGASAYRGETAVDHAPTGYTQTGPGLCVLAPSDGDMAPPRTCRDHASHRTNPVTTADTPGPGGFADDPRALLSLETQSFGFGGTSAAAAQVAGVVALLRQAHRSDTPADIRAKLTGLAAGDGYSARSGYGALDLTGKLEDDA